jgi:hypothetical protein
MGMLIPVPHTKGFRDAPYMPRIEAGRQDILSKPAYLQYFVLQRAGRLTEASSAYGQALSLCQNERDRAYLSRRLTEVSQG